MLSVNLQIRHSDEIVKAGLIVLMQKHFNVSACSENLDQHNGIQVLITDYADAIASLPMAIRNEVRVIVVSQREREGDVRIALDAGVHGYLSQRCGETELRDAVVAVYQGQRYLSESLLDCANKSRKLQKLTIRENEIMRLLAKGCSNKQIANVLNIGVGTVKCHVKSLFAKLGARARTEAVIIAAERGLIQDSYLNFC